MQPMQTCLIDLWTEVIISFVSTEADRQRITLGKWLNGSLINATQKLLRKKFQMRRGYKTQKQRKHHEASSGGVCPKSHWLTATLP